MAKNYRTGAIGALLDEYERSLLHLKEVIDGIPDESLVFVVDEHTADPHCRSMQTVLSHVVHSGYGYATLIHNGKGHDKMRPPMTFHTTVTAYQQDLDAVLAFTEEVLREFTDAELEQFDDALKMRSGWQQVYDVEQMMEHAIVHVLRHRRQLEKFKLLLRL